MNVASRGAVESNIWTPDSSCLFWILLGFICFVTKKGNITVINPSHKDVVSSSKHYLHPFLKQIPKNSLLFFVFVCLTILLVAEVSSHLLTVGSHAGEEGCHGHQSFCRLVCSAASKPCCMLPHSQHPSGSSSTRDIQDYYCRSVLPALASPLVDILGRLSNQTRFEKFHVLLDARSKNLCHGIFQNYIGITGDDVFFFFNAYLGVKLTTSSTDLDPNLGS